LLTVENCNWEKRILSYQRKKTWQWCHLGISIAMEALLKKLPQNGFLFPKIAILKDKDRSAEFCRRCRILEIKGVSLHSYRYAWGELSWENVVWVGADEMNRRKGHNYLTVFVDLAAKRVLLAVEGKDAGT